MKKYIDIHIPTSFCNLNCPYCYVAHEGNRNKEKFELNYSIETIQKALTVKRLGGICFFNVCSNGETLIPKETISIVKALLENGHYVMIVTNGILTNRIEELCQFSEELRKRIIFKFSFHYLQLKDKKLLDTFTNNVNLAKNHGMSYTIEMTPHDELEEYIPEIKKYCLKKFGALCHVTIPRNMNTSKIELLSKHSIDEFYDIWKTFDSELLDFKYSLWGKKRKEFCYAGIWSGLLNIKTGIYSACYIGNISKNIFENIDEPIELPAIGCSCSLPHCYNGHSYLSLGDIPEINSHRNSEIRDRITKDGKHWLTDDMRKFLSGRLEEENEIFNSKQKDQNKKIKIQHYLKKIKGKISKTK